MGSTRIARVDRAESAVGWLCRQASACRWNSLAG